MSGGQLLLLLCVASSFSLPVSTEMPRHPLIKLRLTYDNDVVEGSTLRDIRMRRVLPVLNQRLRDELGVRLQHWDWRYIPTKRTDQTTIDNYYVYLKSRHNIPETDRFVVLFTKDDGKHIGYSVPSIGSGCSKDYIATVVYKKDDEFLKRNLLLALLAQLGVTGKDCACTDCIFDPNSKRLDIPPCAREVLRKSFEKVERPNLSVCTTQTSRDPYQLAICGNGIVETDYKTKETEACDCLIDDKECIHCCDLNTCKRLNPCISDQTPSPSPPMTKGHPKNAKETTATSGPSVKGQLGSSSSTKWYIIGGIGVIAVILLLIAVVVIVKMAKQIRQKSQLRIPSSPSVTRTKSLGSSTSLKNKSVKPALSSNSRSSDSPTKGQTTTEFFA